MGWSSVLSKRNFDLVAVENVEGVTGRLYHMAEVETDMRLEMVRERVQKMESRFIAVDKKLSHSLTKVARSVENVMAGVQMAESSSAEMLKQQIEALGTSVDNAVKRQIKEQTEVLVDKLAELMSKADQKSPRSRRL